MSEELNICKLELLELVNQIESRVQLYREINEPNLAALEHINNLIETAVYKVVDIGVYLEPAPKEESYISFRELDAADIVAMDCRFITLGFAERRKHKVAPLAFNILNQTILRLKYDTPELENQFTSLRKAIQMEFAIS